MKKFATNRPPSTRIFTNVEPLSLCTWKSHTKKLSRRVEAASVGTASR